MRDLTLPSVLALDMLEAFALAGFYQFDPNHWSELSWRLIDAGFATPTVSLLANEAGVMSPVALEQAIRDASCELGVPRFPDAQEAQMIRNACRVCPALANPKALVDRVVSLAYTREGKDESVLLRVGLGDLFEGLSLGPDDLDFEDDAKADFTQSHCQRWAQANKDKIGFYFEAIRKAIG